MDELARQEEIPLPAFIQLGYCLYEPKYCDFERLLSPLDIARLMEDAEVVITHGGPSSFMEALAAKRCPVVVPRMAEYNEHVNDHQVEFCRAVEARFGSIIVVDEMGALAKAVNCAKDVSGSEIASNNERFCKEFARLVDRMVAV